MGVSKGLFSKVRGKIGNLRFQVVKGRQIIAQQPEGYNDAKTETQVAQRNAMSVVVMMARQALGIANASFKKLPRNSSAYNHFVSKNIAQCSIDSNGNPVVNYNMLSYSNGNLPTASESATVNTSTRVVSGTWSNTALVGSNAADMVKVVVVSASADYPAIEGTLGTRDAGSGTFTIPSTFPTGDIYVYTYVLGANGRNASESEYQDTYTL